MPRLGVGMPIVSGVSNAPVTVIDDVLWEDFGGSGGEIAVNYQETRTNSVLYSQDTTQAEQWTKTNTAIDSTLYEAPDNSTTANAIKSNSTGTKVYRILQGSLSVTTGKTYTLSVHVKKGTLGFARVQFNDSSVDYSADFNLNTAAVTNTSNTIRTQVDSMDDDWYRCSITFQAQNTTSSGVAYVFAQSAAGSSTPNVAVSGVILLYVWGFQLEESIEATAYIVTTTEARTATTTLNDTSDVWDFDGADLMPEADPDSEGVWEEGSNLVTNNDYDELSDNFVEVPGFETTYTANQWLAFSSPSTLEISTEQAHEGSSSLKIAGTDGKGVQASATQFTDDYSVNDVVEITAYVYPTISPDNRIKTGVNNSDRSITTLFTGLTLNQWNKIQYQVTISTASNNYISFLNSGTGEFYLDNVSARIVDPNNRWTLSNTTIEDGALTFTDNSSAAQYAFQDNVLTEGNVYEITLTVNRTSGTLNMLFGTGGSSVTGIGSITSSGTYTFITTPLTSAQSGNGRFWPGYTSASDNFIGTVDNITVKEYAITPQDV